MNLNDFLDSVAPSLRPDIPEDRQRALLDGEKPETYEERVWAEWSGRRLPGVQRGTAAGS